MKKIAVVEACDECPFFMYNFNNQSNCLCQKLHLKGTDENLWKVCPLPDDNTFKKRDQNESTLSTKEIYKTEPEGKVFRR